MDSGIILDDQELQSPTGGRVLLPANATSLQPKTFEICSWDTKERRATELELIAYLDWDASGNGAVAASVCVSDWVQLGIRWSHGAGGPSARPSGVGFDTVADAGGLQNWFMPLPARGVRLRLCAREVRVRVRSMLAVTVPVVVSIAPVLSNEPAHTVPRTQTSLYYPDNLTQSRIRLPIGAREWRIAASNPLISVDQYGPSNVGLLQSDIVTALADWQVVHPDALTWTTSLAAAPGVVQRAYAIFR